MQTTQGTGGPAPLWLRALGALALVAIGGSLAFAVTIAVLNFSRIGV